MLESKVEYKRFIWELNNIIELNGIGRNIIFLCIGTNMIVGDSFGPSVGSILKNAFRRNKGIRIIGDLDNVLTYDRIEESMEYIKKEHKNSLVIVIDSALASSCSVGKIFVQNRGLKYAESLKKQNRTIGNISIKAVVGEDTNNSLENFRILKQVSSEKIHELSNFVSSGIVEVVNKKDDIGKNICK